MMNASAIETEEMESTLQIDSSRLDILPEDSSRENFDMVDRAKDKDADQIGSVKDSSTEEKNFQDGIPSSENKAEKQSPVPENKPVSNSEKFLSAELTAGDVGAFFEEFDLEFTNTGYSFSERDGKIDLEKNGRFVGQDIEAFMDASGYYSAVNKAANEGRGVWKSFDEENQTMYIAIITRQENNTVSWNTYKREIKKIEAEEDKEKEEAQSQIEAEEQLEQPANAPQILVNSEQSLNNGMHTPRNISEFWTVLQSEENEQTVTISETQQRESQSADQENFSVETTIPDQQKFEPISLGLEIATVDNSDNAENGPQKSVEEVTTIPEHSAFEEILSVDLPVEVADSSSANDSIEVIVQNTSDSATDTFSTIETVENAATINAAETPTIYAEVPATTETFVNTTVEAQNKSVVEETPVETSTIPIVETTETIEDPTISHQAEISPEVQIVAETTIEAQNAPVAETTPTSTQNSFIEQSQAGANSVFEHLYEQAQRSAANFNESHQVKSEKAKDLLEEVVDSSTSVDGFYGQQATEQRDANKIVEGVVNGHQEIEDLDIPFDDMRLNDTDAEQQTDSITSKDQTTNTNQAETLRVQSLGVENSANNIPTFSEDGPDSTPPQNGEAQVTHIIESSVEEPMIETFIRPIVEQVIKPIEISAKPTEEQTVEHAAEPVIEQFIPSPVEVIRPVDIQIPLKPVEEASRNDIENFSAEHTEEHDTTENIETAPLDIFQEFNQRTAETTGISLVKAPRSNQISASTEAAAETNSLSPQAVRHIASTVQYVQQSDSSNTNKPTITTTAPMAAAINQSN